MCFVCMRKRGDVCWVQPVIRTQDSFDQDPISENNGKGVVLMFIVCLKNKVHCLFYRRVVFRDALI